MAGLIMHTTRHWPGGYQAIENGKTPAGVTDRTGARVARVWSRSGRLYIRARGTWIRSPYQSSPKKTAILAANMALSGAPPAKPAPLPQPLRSPRICAVIAAYTAAAAERARIKGTPRPVTIAANTNAFKRLALQTGAATLDDLSPSVIAAWVKSQSDAGAKPQTTASTIAGARSLFAAWTRPLYAQQGIHIPAHVNAWPAPARPLQRYQERPEALRQRTIEAARALHGERPELWLAYSLIAATGMRAGDAARAQWEWVRPLPDGRPCMIWEAAKNRSVCAVPLDPATLTEWRRINAARIEKSSYILGGSSETRRYALIVRDIAAWMSALGWDQVGSKRAHELRKLMACETLAQTDWATAAAMLGDRVDTLRAHYATIYPSNIPTLNIDAGLPAPPPTRHPPG